VEFVRESEKVKREDGFAAQGRNKAQTRRAWALYTRLLYVAKIQCLCSRCSSHSSTGDINSPNHARVLLQGPSCGTDHARVLNRVLPCSPAACLLVFVFGLGHGRTKEPPQPQPHLSAIPSSPSPASTTCQAAVFASLAWPTAAIRSTLETRPAS
jgi:hypothetical protein